MRANKERRSFAQEYERLSPAKRTHCMDWLRWVREQVRQGWRGEDIVEAPCSCVSARSGSRRIADQLNFCAVDRSIGRLCGNKEGKEEDTETTNKREVAAQGFVEVRDPQDGSLLFRYDPQRQLVEIRKRKVVRLVDLARYGPESAVLN